MGSTAPRKETRVARASVRLTEKQWRKLEPLLPPRPARPRGGRRWISHRSVLEGVLWVLKTGARWRDLPDESPSAATCWRRLRRWEEDGVWLRIWRAYLSELDARGRLHWEETFIDGTFSPAKKGGPKSGKPSGARAESSWWWSTARVFLREFPPPRPLRRRSRSSRRRSQRSPSRGTVPGDRGPDRTD